MAESYELQTFSKTPDSKILDAEFSVNAPDRCPNCGFEHIRKVSAVFGEQNGMTSATSLATSLGPPVYPQTPNANNGNIDAGCAGYGYGCGAAFLIALLGAGIFSSNKSGSSGAFVFPIAAVIGFLVGKHLRDSGRGKAQADLSVKLTERRRDMNVFESKYAVWDRLYYCSKCDRAINPITSKTAAPYAWQLLI